MGKSRNNDPLGSARDKNLEKKAAAAAERAAREAEEEERREAASWEVGAKRDKSRNLELQRDQKLKIKAENAQIIAAEEAAAAGLSRPKTPNGGGKKKKKGADSLELLNAALASAPKTKAQKDAELRARDTEKRQEEESKRQAARAVARAAEEKERLERARLGIVSDHAEELLLHSKELNVMEDVEGDKGAPSSVFVTGVSEALDALSTESPMVDAHPERRRRALYQAFFDQMLPQMKEDFPNLRLTQYEERIFQLWQKSPKNPINASLR